MRCVLKIRNVLAMRTESGWRKKYKEADAIPHANTYCFLVEERGRNSAAG
jgi:hypothetical protein